MLKMSRGMLSLSRLFEISITVLLDRSPAAEERARPSDRYLSGAAVNYTPESARTFRLGRRKRLPGNSPEKRLLDMSTVESCT